MSLYTQNRTAGEKKLKSSRRNSRKCLTGTGDEQINPRNGGSQVENPSNPLSSLCRAEDQCESVSLSTFAQAARWTGVPPQVRGARRGWGAAASDRPAPATAAQGLLRTFKVMDQKPKLQMHAGRLGEAGRTGWRKTEGRPPGDCDLGAGPREAKLAAVTECRIKALGSDSGGKKVLEEMKEQSRLPVCPHWVGHYLFCMTNRRKTIPEQRGASDATRGTQGRAGVRGRAGAGSAGFVQGGTKDTRLPVLGNLCPLECGALGLGVLYCSPSSLGWVPGWRGWLGASPPTAAPTSGYTSVEKYSVFRFSSAKEMGGCCR